VVLEKREGKTTQVEYRSGINAYLPEPIFEDERQKIETI